MKRSSVAVVFFTLLFHALPFGVMPVGAAVQRAGLMRYVKKEAPAPAQKQTELRAPCPRNTVAVGGGVFTSGGSLNDEVATSAPYDSKDRGRVPDDGWVGEINSGADNEDMDVHAVCAPFLGIKYKTKELTVNPGKRRVQFLPCPDRFPQVLGGGVRTSGKSTKVALAESVLDASLGLWQVGVNNGTSGRLDFTGYVICADLTDIGVEGYSNPTAEVGQTHADIFCSPEDDVLAGGARVSGGLDAEIASLRPADDSSDSDVVPDNGWEAWFNNGTGSNKPARISRTCLG